MIYVIFMRAIVFRRYGDEIIYEKKKIILFRRMGNGNPKFSIKVHCFNTLRVPPKQLFTNKKRSSH